MFAYVFDLGARKHIRAQDYLGLHTSAIFGFDFFREFFECLIFVNFIIFEFPARLPLGAQFGFETEVAWLKWPSFQTAVSNPGGLGDLRSRSAINGFDDEGSGIWA